MTDTVGEEEKNPETLILDEVRGQCLHLQQSVKSRVDMVGTVARHKYDQSISSFFC